MPLKIKHRPSGQAYVSGQTREFIKYEKDIISGKIPCPFTSQFKNQDGEIVYTGFLHLKSNGVSKIKFDFANPHEIGTNKWWGIK